MACLVSVAKCSRNPPNPDLSLVEEHVGLALKSYSICGGAMAQSRVRAQVARTERQLPDRGFTESERRADRIKRLHQAN
jgi:hypothetical protein